MAQAQAQALALLVLLILGAASGSKLNVPRVLLPFSEEGTSFRLKAETGSACYKWKSSRPEVVIIILIKLI